MPDPKVTVSGKPSGVLTTEHAAVPVRATTKPELPLEFENVVARQLVEPDFLNLKPSNPAMAFRWINHVAGNGMRLGQMQAMGFVVCKPTDVRDCPPVYQRDGSVKNGDLLLVMIERNKLAGAVRYNAERAFKLGSKGELTNKARNTIREISAPPDIHGKINVFIPSEKEMEGRS